MKSKNYTGRQLGQWRKELGQTIDFVVAVTGIIGEPTSQASVSMLERGGQLGIPRTKVQRALLEIETVQKLLGPVGPDEVLSEIRRRAQARSARTAGPARATAATSSNAA